jgi:hypothetical protein
VDLSLNAAEREHLAALGVSPDAQGVLRSAGGREVSAATAVALLAKSAAAQGRMARPGPAGPPGPVGSGTADRTMAADEDEDLVPGGDEDGEGVGPPDGGDLSKGLVPSRFMRPYLSASHAADSPANTGMRGTTAVPETSRDIEPQDYRHGWLQPGHQDASPDDDPAGNNPHFGTAAGRYEMNSSLARTDHMMPSASMRAGAEPVPARAAMPADLRASSVPVSVQMQATAASPGEAR